MKKVLEGPQQREILLSWIKDGKRGDQVDLISPWISGESLRRVLDVLPKDVRLNIVTRFPATPDELNFTDWGALMQAGAKYDNVNISVVGDPGRLHAKVYRVAGRGAIVTSANLTETGLSSDLSGNLELGVLLDSEKPLHDLDRWVRELKIKPLHLKRLELLQKRQEALMAWYKKIQKIDGRPEVPPNPSLGSDLAADVISMAIKNGEMRDASRLDGHGVRAFELDLNSRKPAYRVKVVTSQARKAEIAGVEQEFHFELKVDLLKQWRKNGGPIHGVILVSCKKDNAGRDVLIESPPPCFLPFSFLFDKKEGLPYEKFVKGRKGSDAQTPTINLSRMKGSDVWILRYRFNLDGRKVKGFAKLPTRGCFASTRLMKQFSNRAK